MLFWGVSTPNVHSIPWRHISGVPGLTDKEYRDSLLPGAEIRCGELGKTSKLSNGYCLLAMASNLQPNSDGLQPRSNDFQALKRSSSSFYLRTDLLLAPNMVTQRRVGRRPGWPSPSSMRFCQALKHPVNPQSFDWKVPTPRSQADHAGQQRLRPQRLGLGAINTFLEDLWCFVLGAVGALKLCQSCCRKDVCH